MKCLASVWSGWHLFVGISAVYHNVIMLLKYSFFSLYPYCCYCHCKTLKIMPLKRNLIFNKMKFNFFSLKSRDSTFDELLNEWLHSTTSDKNPVDYRDIGLMGNEWEIIYMDIDFSVLYDFKFWIYWLSQGLGWVSWIIIIGIQMNWSFFCVQILYKKILLPFFLFKQKREIWVNKRVR